MIRQISDNFINCASFFFFLLFRIENKFIEGRVRMVKLISIFGDFFFSSYLTTKKKKKNLKNTFANIDKKSY